MKATLTIGASRLTTDLTIDRLNTVLETFIEQIDDHVGADAGDADPDEEDGVLTNVETEELFDLEDDTPPVSPARGLMHFKCPSCSRSPFRKITESLLPGDIITCDCGREIEVFDIREASGSCPKCNNQFWNIWMVNRLDSISCKKCRSVITLVDAGNGTLGTDRR